MTAGSWASTPATQNLVGSATSTSPSDGPGISTALGNPGYPVHPTPSIWNSAGLGTSTSHGHATLTSHDNPDAPLNSDHANEVIAFLE